MPDVAREDAGVVEVVGGRSVPMAPLAPDALAVKLALGADLEQGLAGLSGRMGWSIYSDPKLRFAQDVLVPDLAGWRRPRQPRGPIENHFGHAPDWACEVLSPATAVLDRTRKLNVYATGGVCWLWLVDPRHRTIEVLWLEGDEWVVAGAHGGDELARISPFDPIQLDLTELWRAAASAAGTTAALGR